MNKIFIVICCLLFITSFIKAEDTEDEITRLKSENKALRAVINRQAAIIKDLRKQLQAKEKVSKPKIEDKKQKEQKKVEKESWNNVYGKVSNISSYTNAIIKVIVYKKSSDGLYRITGQTNVLCDKRSVWSQLKLLQKYVFVIDERSRLIRFYSWPKDVKTGPWDGNSAMEAMEKLVNKEKRR